MPQFVFVFLIAFGNALLPLIAAAQPTVPEIPNPAINDISIAQMTPQGPVIYYNPALCQQIGPLVCGFYRAHEYGHVMLGHLLGGTHPQMAEMQADCFGAVNDSPQETMAAIQFFQMQAQAGDMAHGTGSQRAQRINDAFMSGGRNCHW